MIKRLTDPKVSHGLAAVVTTGSALLMAFELVNSAQAAAITAFMAAIAALLHLWHNPAMGKFGEPLDDVPTWTEQD